MTSKTITCISIIVIVETYCVYPLLGSMVNVDLSYTIFLSLLVATVFCVFAYVGSYLGIGQLFVIPDLPEIKRDKVRAWSIFAITLLGVFAIQGSLCFLLYNQVSKLEYGNITQDYLPMILQVMPTLVSVICGIPNAEANRHEKYPEEMYVKEVFHKRGIKDGQGEPFKQSEISGVYYTNFIDIKMKEFDAMLKEDWKKNYIPRLSKLNVDIVGRNQEGTMFRENAILTLQTMSKNLETITDEGFARVAYADITKYLNEINSAIRIKNTEGKKIECEAHETKVLYDVTFSEMQTKYLARLTIYWDILLNTYKEKINKEHDVKDIGQLPKLDDLMRICSIKNTSVDYKINEYVNVENIPPYNHR